MQNMSAKRKPNRRRFISGKAAADAARDAVRGAAPEDAESRPTGETSGGEYLVQVGRRAMACEFSIYFDAGKYSQGTEAAGKALDLVERLEAVMTVFRRDSALNRINRRAADKAVKVKPDLFGLLGRAVELCRQTGGAFDITSGPLSELWGFAKRAGSMPNKADLAASLDNVGSVLVELDEEKKTVRFKKPGVRLNLGGIGKGFALDRAAELLEEAGVGDFLFHGGNSSVLACGSRMETLPAGGSSADPGR
jgi:thiamine biosynthesis lipoprotein